MATKRRAKIINDTVQNFFMGHHHKILTFKTFTLLILFITLCFSESYGQSAVDSVDLNKVYQKRKKKFVKNKYLKNLNSFNQLLPTCYKTSDSSNFNLQIDEYYINKSINTVWNQYKNIDLKQSYSGNLVKFGFLYCKTENKIIYSGDKSYRGMREGQVVFIRLDLLKGIKKLVVAYEITEIDETHKTIQFCYIKNGISEGSQKIFLSETPNGNTKIIHKTFFKSNSKFRDKRIYPGFHKRVITELHQNLINSLH
jgi:hypothetical protein